VARLRSLGAVMVGITNCSEFACKGITTNLVYGTTRNPWDTDLTPGGSSGGAAAATAARFAPLALCTDAGGSVRRPAAHTGLVGLKPSMGVVPQPGGFPEPNLGISVTGVLARNVADAALAFEHLVGHHPGDPFSLPATLDSDMRAARLAWSPRLGCGFAIDHDVLQAFEAAIVKLRGAGHAIAEADPAGLPAHANTRCWACSRLALPPCSRRRWMNGAPISTPISRCKSIPAAATPAPRSRA